MQATPFLCISDLPLRLNSLVAQDYRTVICVMWYNISRLRFLAVDKDLFLKLLVSSLLDVSLCALVEKDCCLPVTSISRSPALQTSCAETPANNMILYIVYMS